MCMRHSKGLEKRVSKLYMGPRITLTELNKNWKREQVNTKQEIKKQEEISEHKR